MLPEDLQKARALSRPSDTEIMAGLLALQEEQNQLNALIKEAERRLKINQEEISLLYRKYGKATIKDGGLVWS